MDMLPPDMVIPNGVYSPQTSFLVKSSLMTEPFETTGHYNKGMRAGREPRGNGMMERKSNKPGQPAEMPSTASPQKTASLGPEIRDRIARELRSMWDEVVKEGVPPQFADFIDRLAQQEKPSDSAPDESADPVRSAAQAVGDEDDKGPR